MNKASKLKSDIAKQIADPFDTGDVIRWAAGTFGQYTYVAVRTPSAWYTTATIGNGHAPQRLEYEGLVDVLTANDVSDIEIAATWEEVLR